MQQRLHNEVAGVLQGIAREIGLIIRAFGLALLFGEQPASRRPGGRRAGSGRGRR